MRQDAASTPVLNYHVDISHANMALEVKYVGCGLTPEQKLYGQPVSTSKLGITGLISLPNFMISYNGN